MKDTLKLILGAFVAGFLFAGYKALDNWAKKGEAPRPATQGAQSIGVGGGQADSTVTYDKAGVSFRYPRSWRSFPSQAVNGMKGQMAAELRKYNRTLLSLDMYISSDEEVAFFVSKVRAENGLSTDAILSERRKFYDDAKRAGDVTAINKLETTTINGQPAVVEDVERSNGGRGHTVKLLKGEVLVELSLIVNDKSKYAKHTHEYEQILATLSIQD
jgi:hypothetical protein